MSVSVPMMSILTSLFTALPLFLQPLSADLLPIFSFPPFANNTGFAPDISLLGDAQMVVADGGSHVRLTRASNSSFGRVAYRRPIQLSYEDDTTASVTKVSFSTHFSFAMSPGNGDGLAFFLLFPTGAGSFGLSQTVSKVVAIELGASASGPSVGIYIGNSSGLLESVTTARNTTPNVSSLNTGERFDCWIDYRAGSNRIEVALTESGHQRPSHPLLSYFPIDLSGLWNKGEEVLMGLGSSNRNSTQTCTLYSWSCKVRIVPHWLHSQPYLPDALSSPKGDVDGDAGDASHSHRRGNCVLRFLGAVIFGTGCGALGAFFALLAWTLLGERWRRPAAVVPAPQEFSGCCPGEFEYKKIKVAAVAAEDKEGVAMGSVEK